MGLRETEITLSTEELRYLVAACEHSIQVAHKEYKGTKRSEEIQKITQLRYRLRKQLESKLYNN
jgi:hypothetical protein